MNKQKWSVLLAAFLIVAATHPLPGQEPYRVKPNHPRLFIADPRELARHCDGPLAADYQVVKQRADADGDAKVLSTGRSRMFMHTLLPAQAEIVIRGGADQLAWGHPLEKTAQYNHTGEGRLRPPICPWRIEVADAGPQARTLFLHVFEITREDIHDSTGIRLIAPATVAIGDRWLVRFNPTGPIGGRVGDKPLASTIDTAAQYPAKPSAGR